MAQKVTGLIKLQIPAGKATPAPPVGPALGQHGVNIMAFTKEFNEHDRWYCTQHGHRSRRLITRVGGTNPILPLNREENQ